MAIKGRFGRYTLLELWLHILYGIWPRFHVSFGPQTFRKPKVQGVAAPRSRRESGA